MTTWHRPTGPQVELGDHISNLLGVWMAQNFHTKMSMTMNPDKDGAYVISAGWREHSGYDSVGWLDPKPILTIRVKLDENPAIRVTYAPPFEINEGVRTSFGIENHEVAEMVIGIGNTLAHFNPRNHPEIR
ncbi:MAG: hypothetical protein V4473_01560 [Patescibacteria group bacterium]